jgi:predicted MFS family arabinose efflux permease
MKARRMPNIKEQAASGRQFGARFTFPLLLGSTLNPINSSMIATGLVGIAADFHTGPGQAATLVSVLYLCSAVMQPTMGKLSTLFGPRRIFQKTIETPGPAPTPIGRVLPCQDSCRH